MRLVVRARTRSSSDAYRKTYPPNSGASEVRFRPREMRHQEIGQHVLSRLVESMRDIALVEAEGRGEVNARMISIMISPKKTAAAAKA